MMKQPGPHWRTDLVQGLDRPLLADIAGQVGGACPPGFRTRDAERGDGRDRLAAQAGDVPLDEEHLADVREREVIGSGQDLDGPGGNPAVALIGGGMSDRDLVPRRVGTGRSRFALPRPAASHLDCALGRR